MKKHYVNEVVIAGKVMFSNPYEMDGKIIATCVTLFVEVNGHKDYPKVYFVGADAEKATAFKKNAKLAIKGHFVNMKLGNTGRHCIQVDSYIEDTLNKFDYINEFRVSLKVTNIKAISESIVKCIGTISNGVSLDLGCYNSIVAIAMKAKKGQTVFVNGCINTTKKEDASGCHYYQNVMARHMFLT